MQYEYVMTSMNAILIDFLQMASTYQSSSPSDRLSLQYDSVSLQQRRPHVIRHQWSGELRVKTAPVPERKRKCDR